MFRYIAKRLLAGVITIWFIATATFFAMHAVPGDPLMNDKAVSDEVRRNLEARYGLDKPLGEQYIIFISNRINMFSRNAGDGEYSFCCYFNNFSFL